MLYTIGNVTTEVEDKTSNILIKVKTLKETVRLKDAEGLLQSCADCSRCHPEAVQGDKRIQMFFPAMNCFKLWKGT